MGVGWVYLGVRGSKMWLKLPEMDFLAEITSVQRGIGSLFVEIESQSMFLPLGATQSIEIVYDGHQYEASGVVDLDCIIDDKNKRLEIL